MITRVIPAQKPIDHNSEESRPNQSMATEKIIGKKSQPNNIIGFQHQTQTIFLFFWNPIKNNSDITESLPHKEV